MSTLEKFGILVILVLVVIIGVVAVWGVGGGEENPFDATAPMDPAAAVPDPALGDPMQPDWPGTTTPPVTADAGAAPVAPPTIGSTPSPATGFGPAPVPAPAAGVTKYRIKKGDTLAGIAKSVLGDGNRWKDIVAANPGLDARRLKIDQEINIPTGSGPYVAEKAPAPKVPSPKAPVKSLTNPADGPSAPEIRTPPPAPAGGFREVEVRSGDTLYEISRRELGNPDLYFKILKANPGLDPKRLKLGQKVRIPTDG